MLLPSYHPTIIWPRALASPQTAPQATLVRGKAIMAATVALPPVRPPPQEQAMVGGEDADVDSLFAQVDESQ